MIQSKDFKKDHWAYDISKNIVLKGEIWDDDVIKQSVELIIATYFGERLFNPTFGSDLTSYLFTGLTEVNGEKLLDSIINSITIWEDRVTVLSNQCRMKISTSSNSISLTLPYVINRSNIKSTFEKKIIF